ncbi:DEAD/DEAH box helicase [Pseudactinotalea sp.]|uniref:DEAD/DEAH box helicase n=1 Tax=Pseudactinotalea sp. TaxID=1926260 RepID=UPI003B3A9D5F
MQAAGSASVSAESTLGVLLTGAREQDCLVHLEHLPARAAVTGAWPAWADADLVAGYRARGVATPWRHQSEAAEHAWAGRHVVIATSTGSGKSLPAWLSAVTAIRANRSGGRLSELSRRPAALYLSPTKALAADQLHGLQALLDAAGIRDVRATTVDGDTSLDERDWARDHADIVLSNPDFLHFSMLPGHRRWQRLLRGLRFVVVDECHAYRGVMGAHVALVLRRLLRLADHYGGRPTVVLASATTGEPAVTAARLIGVMPQEVAAVTEDGSPAGRRTIALWQPPLADGLEETGADSLDDSPISGTPDAPRRSTLSEVADLLGDLVKARRRTLAFVRSRLGAEVIADHARARVRSPWQPPSGAGTARAVTVNAAPEVGADVVAAYRGGYLPEERRELERALRTGDLLGLATTNALELGVDIAGLDAVLIAGWPGTRTSLWQQIGRAGRAGAEGVAVLVASDDPLDAYLLRHPEAIFGAPVEATSFDPGNPYVLAPHLCAAAGELPIGAADLERFGLVDDLLLDELVARGLLRRRGRSWYWNYDRAESPQSLTDLRGGSDAVVSVVEEQTGAVVGTVDGARADAVVHEGAIYTHQGRTYRVTQYADDVALVVTERPPFRTRARSERHVRILASTEEAAWGPVTWHRGSIEVTSRVIGYDRRRLPGLDLIGSYALDLPERVLRTAAVWWTVEADVLSDAGIGPDELPGALHAAEHASIGLLPLIATCDRWDIGGLSTALHADTFMPTVFIYDGYPGGAGFSERGFGAARPWMRATRDAVAACPCRDGCPACVQSPKCGNGNNPLSKAGAARVLTLLLTHAPTVPRSRF